MQRMSRVARVRAQVVGATTVATLVCFAGLGVATAQDANTSASSGGVANNDGRPSVTTGDIITGQNTGHVVSTGNTANGDVSIVIGDMTSSTEQTIFATTGPQVGDAAGGNGGMAGPGLGGPPDKVVIHSNPKSSSRSNSTATGGAGGAGGDGGDATGGAGGSGGTGSGGTGGTGGSGGSGGDSGSGNSGSSGTGDSGTGS